MFVFTSCCSHHFIMVLVVVVKEGDGKKFISGTSVLEIILKAKESFGMTDECPTSDFKLCVTSGEASGLEVEDDDTFNELVKSRKPELLSLEFLSKDKSCSGMYDFIGYFPIVSNYPLIC
ncbi:uncharacterized protein LOC127752166 [Frankliniella occidentalis]|uniref:Uncharacterized protein LOC127752166 n=1 Tax=Frankliniella occidentalis TaxID=133901 RepID=A0A9C6XBQ6_FRAOC|nr:uncharacterized protein LOC127752166 [Frankliniella occidentalis]